MVTISTVTMTTAPNLPDDVGRLQFADGDDVLGNGSIVVPLAGWGHTMYCTNCSSPCSGSCSHHN